MIISTLKKTTYQLQIVKIEFLLDMSYIEIININDKIIAILIINCTYKKKYKNIQKYLNIILKRLNQRVKNMGTKEVREFRQISSHETRKESKTVCTTLQVYNQKFSTRLQIVHSYNLLQGRVYHRVSGSWPKLAKQHDELRNIAPILELRCLIKGLGRPLSYIVIYMYLTNVVSIIA